MAKHNTKPLPLFDGLESERRKTDGMVRAADNKNKLLSVAREIADDLVSRFPAGITADDVVHELVERGFDERCLGNSAGALFKARQWVWTGEFRKSKRAHAHSNLLRVWRKHVET